MPTPSGHPDNAPGQDLGFGLGDGRAKGTIEAGQSLFSLSSSRERSELS